MSPQTKMNVMNVNMSLVPWKIEENISNDDIVIFSKDLLQGPKELI